MPQPIEIAPKDTPILTDCGFAICIYDEYHKKWQWMECDPFGNIYDDSDYGPWFCSPNNWDFVPEWITK